MLCCVHLIVVLIYELYFWQAIVAVSEHCIYVCMYVCMYVICTCMSGMCITFVLQIGGSNDYFILHMYMRVQRYYDIGCFSSYT